MLRDKDLRISVKVLGRAQSDRGPFKVTVTHWPTKISVNAAGTTADQLGDVVTRCVYLLERSVASYMHRTRRKQPHK